MKTVKNMVMRYMVAAFMISIVTERLSAARADVDVRNEKGETRLMLADDIDTARALIAQRADVNAQDAQGKTALMKVSDLEVIGALLTAKADPNARDKEGNTVLMSIKNADAIASLYAAGADLNAQNAQGHTALWRGMLGQPLAVDLGLVPGDENLKTKEYVGWLLHFGATPSDSEGWNSSGDFICNQWTLQSDPEDECLFHEVCALTTVRIFDYKDWNNQFQQGLASALAYGLIDFMPNDLQAIVFDYVLSDASYGRDRFDKQQFALYCKVKAMREYALNPKKNNKKAQKRQCIVS